MTTVSSLMTGRGRSARRTSSPTDSSSYTSSFFGRRNFDIVFAVRVPIWLTAVCFRLDHLDLFVSFCTVHNSFQRQVWPGRTRSFSVVHGVRVFARVRTYLFSISVSTEVVRTTELCVWCERFSLSNRCHVHFTPSHPLVRRSFCRQVVQSCCSSFVRNDMLPPEHQVSDSSAMFEMQYPLNCLRGE